MPPKEPPQRLDSLNRRGASSSASSSSSRSRFLPKVVARRSKEEREQTAPAEKPVVDETKVKTSESFNVRGRGGGRGRGDRGRGDRGRGRGGGRGGRFQPSVAAMGPFASPSAVQDRSRRSATPSFEIREGTPSYVPGAIRVKSETPGVGSSENNTPAPEDEHRIDMTSNIPIEGEAAAFFPIRLDRREDDSDEEDLPPPQSSAAEDVETAGEVKIKDDPDGPAKVKKEEPKLYLSAQQKKELERIQLDHEEITEEFHIKASIDESKSKALEQKLYFFQFPAVLPEFDEETEDNQNLEGLMGHLRLHESGNLTMVVGNIVMEVSQGTECNFLQDVVVMNREDKKSYLIGQVSRKMVVSPDISRLLNA